MMNILPSSRDVSLTTTPTVVVFDGFYMTTMIHLPLFLKKEQVVGTSVLSGCCSGVAFSTASNMTQQAVVVDAETTWWVQTQADAIQPCLEPLLLFFTTEVHVQGVSTTVFRRMCRRRHFSWLKSVRYGLFLLVSSVIVCQHDVEVYL